MFEWSDTDIIMRDAMRQFIDKEIRPHLDELESGELPPYPIARKLFSEFGLDVMAAEAVKGMLEKERAKATSTCEGKPEKKDGGGFGEMGAQVSMAAVMVSELAGRQHRAAQHRRCQPRTGRGDHHEPRHAGAEGALAARADDAGEDRRVGDHRTRRGLGCLRRHEDLRQA